MAYADYTYYTDEYMGDTLTESLFQRNSTLASLYIDKHTKGRLKREPALVDNSVRSACCAVAELLQTSAVSGSDRGAVASETVDEHSISFESGTSKTMEQQILDLLWLYLGDTGLLGAAIPYIPLVW